MTDRQAKTPKTSILATSLAAILVALVLIANSSVALGHARHHVVRPGDTLSSIAKAHGTSVAALLELNDIANQDLIFAGETLLVAPDEGQAEAASPATPQPAATGAAPAASATADLATAGSETAAPEAAGSDAASSSPETDTSTWRKYVIQPGDWLATIAKRFDLTVAELAKANQISNPNLIFAGQTILVPQQPASRTATPPNSQPESEASPPPELPEATAADPSPELPAAAATDPETPEANSTPPAAANPTPPATTSSGLAVPAIPEPGIDLSSVPATGSDSPVPPPDETRSATAERSTAGRVVELRHKVKPGDTLAQLAAAYGLSDHQTLLAANPGLAPEALAAGSFITIAGVTVEDRLEHWGRHYGIPLEFFKAITWWESGWNNSLVSWAAAIGIGQLIPATVDFVSGVLIGVKLDPHNPDDNIRMSARFLRYLLDETGNDRALTLGAYYQGLYAVRTKGIYNSSVPYVTGILALQSKFR